MPSVVKLKIKKLMKRQIAILGSTGSIGTQALQVIKEHPDLYEVYALTANNKADFKVLKGLYEELSLEDIQGLTARAVNQPTKSAQEEKIIAVLTKFLGSTQSTISSWSSIYELGLDSISVIGFSRNLREAGFPQAQPSLIMTRKSRKY